MGRQSARCDHLPAGSALRRRGGSAKAWVADPLGDIGYAARKEIVETDHLLAGSNKPLNRVRPDEAGAVGDKIAWEGGWHRRSNI